MEGSVTDLGRRIMAAAEEEKEAMISFLMDIAAMETPSDVPESQRPIQAYLTEAMEALDFRVRRTRGRESGGELLAVPRGRIRGRPAQLMIGHCDTVWPQGTLDTMPLVRDGNRLRGPGVFDMKAGLTQMIFALRILRRLELEPEVTPVVLINSDEETGSAESRDLIRLVARRVIRVFIPEPAMGERGIVKTVRKGMAHYTLTVKGKAAHAGLDPTGGASAILELSHLIRTLHGMTDLDRGVSVNVGVVAGGSRPNVIAPLARAEVDVRVMANADAGEVRERIRSLRTTVPGTSLEVKEKVAVPPMERTDRNRALWEATRWAGVELGLTLEEGVSGGGSDGNTTSQFTATLDGLGAVGDGAHAAHEFIYLDRQVERCALLARLLLLSP